ncbi:electron transport complex subunit RsxC [Thaumasiovibrio sp. DFM-14]|uniref:electron transport complex subunit RsxC n=1 Tax=Thaumasiovibrio sp. DFM-14 TaxID=3384792 RepID=UPI00399EEF0E
MLDTIQQIKNGKLWDFPGGVHPQDNKQQSNQTPIAQAPLADEYVIPLKQHIGATGDICVSVGEQVKKGQALTVADVAMCVPIHAPTSGQVIAIETRTIAHPSGLDDLCIIIKPDGEDTWTERHPVANFRCAEPNDLLEKIRLSGISGMGGAGFPTNRKLQSAMGHTELLIINAAECEPYITADDRLMQDHADEVIDGAKILAHILKPALTIIAIEDNKPEAIRALHEITNENDQIIIRVIPTKYPSGGEKQLIKLLTGREVPTKGLPSDIGIMMQNVGTTYAIKRAIVDGEPLIERVVTMTGDALSKRANTWVRIGTPVSTLLAAYGHQPKRKDRVILGGPMMGFTLPHTAVPVTKTVNCILAPTTKEIPVSNREMACIRCSSCADACPASLLPQQLQWYARDKNYDKCAEYNLTDCIECGACAYVCPSQIPLVKYYRQAKAEIRQRDIDAQKSERARQRFEAKQARLERDKQERENRHKLAAQNRVASTKSTDSDAIAAAIARVKAQKSALTQTDNAPKPAVAAAIARAKAKQAAAQSSTSTQPDNSEMNQLREERKRLAREKKAAKAAQAESPEQESTESPPPTNKKDAVAAAIARAKARKAAQQAESAPSDAHTEPTANKENTAAATDADPKKAAVAAAIARAKARKAAQQAESAPSDAHAESAANKEDTAAVADADPKKAAVAAAIARAKARKAAQQADSAPTDTHAEPAANKEETAAVADTDPKKAAVAAAIARAKARKAALKAQQEEE